MPSCPVVAPAITRLYLVDVAKRAQKELLARTDPKPTDAEIAEAAVQVKAAEANGDWIDVKARLSKGEKDDGFTSLVKGGMYAGQKAELDPKKVQLVVFRQYVLGWSFLGLDGKALPIEAVDSIDPDRFDEITLALDQHVKDIEAETKARKNALASASASS